MRRKNMILNLDKYLKDKALVEIDGHIMPLKNGGAVGHQEFVTEFTRWLESKGWAFTGFTVQVDADGEHIEDIDE